MEQDSQWKDLWMLDLINNVKHSIQQISDFKELNDLSKLEILLGGDRALTAACINMTQPEGQ